MLSMYVLGLGNPSSQLNTDFNQLFIFCLENRFNVFIPKTHPVTAVLGGHQSVSDPKVKGMCWSESVMMIHQSEYRHTTSVVCL